MQKDGSVESPQCVRQSLSTLASEHLLNNSEEKEF